MSWWRTILDALNAGKPAPTPHASHTGPAYSLNIRATDAVVTARHPAGIVVRARHPQTGWDFLGEAGVFIPAGEARAVTYGGGWNAEYRMGTGGDWLPLR